MKNVLFVSIFAAGAAFASGTQPTAYEIDPSHSSVNFQVKHMMVSNVHGQFSKVTGNAFFDPQDLSHSKLQATIDASTVDTHEPQRDAHLKSPDFLDTAKFPSLTFTSRKFYKDASGKLKIAGDLAIHGVTKEVTLDVDGPTPEAKDPWGNFRIGASGTTKINRTDYGLVWNKALETGGVLVGDEVAITLEVELVKKK